jgi:hypothetical protein
VERLPDVDADGAVVHFRRQFHLFVAKRAAHHHRIHARTSHHAGERVAEVVPAADFHSGRCRCRMYPFRSAHANVIRITKRNVRSEDLLYLSACLVRQS